MRKLLLLCATIALAVTMAPGAAYASKADCSSNRMCFWHHQNYEGDILQLQASDRHFGDHSDEAHSVYNNTKVAWVLYDDKDYADRHFCIRAGVSNRDIGAAPYKFGDKITSAKRRPNNSCGGLPQIRQN